MHFARSVLLAGMAVSTLAAPTSNNKLVKRSFAVPVKGHNLRAPLDEMCNAFRKHGWEIIFLQPESSSYGPPASYSSSPALPDVYGLPSSSAAALPNGYGSPSSEAPAYPGGYGMTSSVPPFPIPSEAPSSGVAPPFGTGIPSGGFTSVVPFPSGTGAPAPSFSVPAQSSLTASGASPPAASSSTPTEDGETGEVTASPEQYESEYLSPVSIGGQMLNLNFDTGSGDLWVFSTELPENEQAGHSVYDPTKSDSWEELERASWQIQYGDGSTAGGVVGYDTVAIGDAVVTKQAVELATDVSAQFLRDENSDGLLGLSFSGLNTVQPQPQKTWFENIQDQLDEPLFTADLEEDNSGTYEFGTIDTSKYSGELHYTPIDNSEGWWQFPSEFITVGGERTECSICSPAIADTGTSLALMDDDLVEAFYDQVQGAQYDSTNGGYTYPCDAKLPDVGIAIGPDYTAILSGEELTYAEIDAGVCFGGIQGNGASQGSGTPVQIIGAVLLKQYFAVFDAGKLRFGIAKKN